MNDRELLERAAKAAGYRDFAEGNFAAHGKYNVGPDEQGRWIDWNPLTDDGDALRLAVKLGINPPIGACSPVDGDPCAPARRAIVRAAAALALDQVPLDPLP